PVRDPLAIVRERLEADDLDGADQILSAERAHRDSVELQWLLGALAEKRGNALGALAHYHRATRIAPDRPETHAQLARILALTEQRDAACREARLALLHDPKSAVARAATDAAHCPRAKENHP